jgi:uncharacterized protein YkwD
MRLSLLSASIALAAMIGGIALPATMATACTSALTRQIESEIIAGVNALRAQNGLSPVQPDATLGRIAQGHACDNAARRSFSHTGSDGSDLGRRLDRGGYRWRSAIENTGLGQKTPAAMIAYWTKSSGHRANILQGDLREAGVGVARGSDGRNAWVLVMAR